MQHVACCPLEFEIFDTLFEARILTDGAAYNPNPSYQLSAVPLVLGRSGFRSLFADESQVIRLDVTGNRAGRFYTD